jgi:hypothetical protein
MSGCWRERLAREGQAGTPQSEDGGARGVVSPERPDQTEKNRPNEEYPDQTLQNVLNVTQLLSCYALQRLPPSFRE